ncbi:unnamed protein product [Brassica napus]|uniref:(rape) hypothetical protein n=1 Tax=Brassica napus TaxID=3708 RepID=A0A816XYT1_BRANA|nr:unnamed protein product [Brassica napus]
MMPRPNSELNVGEEGLREGFGVSAAVLTRSGHISRIRRSEPVITRKIGFRIGVGYRKIPGRIRFKIWSGTGSDTGIIRDPYGYLEYLWFFWIKFGSIGLNSLVYSKNRTESVNILVTTDVTGSESDPTDGSNLKRVSVPALLFTTRPQSPGQGIQIYLMGPRETAYFSVNHMQTWTFFLFSLVVGFIHTQTYTCFLESSSHCHMTKVVVSFIEIRLNVFLNYRGDQLRYGFVSHLIDAFERYGIMFFIDKHEQRGKDLTNLFVRMKESKIALVIFSSSISRSPSFGNKSSKVDVLIVCLRRYAESSWCMDELVNIKKRAEKGKLEVIPIFYKVRAKDVRAQAGKFGDKFWALAKVSSGDQIKKWKDALECISNKMGLSLRDKSSEADFIKGIVKEVERVRTATVRGGAQSHHCIKFIPNKRIKISKKFPEDEAKSVEIAHMNFSNATGEEEPSQEVLVLNHDFVK